MSRCVIPFYVCVCAWVGVADAAQWVFVANLGDGEMLALDQTSWEADAPSMPMRHAWFRFSGGRPKQTTWSHGKAFTWSVTYTHANCKPHKIMAASQVAYYDDNGKVVGAEEVEVTPGRFIEPIPGSVSELIFNILCGEYHQ
jgi:hypothetical protein